MTKEQHEAIFDAINIARETAVSLHWTSLSLTTALFVLLMAVTIYLLFTVEKLSRELKRVTQGSWLAGRPATDGHGPKQGRGDDNSARDQ